MHLLLAAVLFAPAAPVPKDTTRDDALKVLLARAEDKDEKVRAEAVRRMGTLEHPPAVPHVEKFLKDDSPIVRLAAVLALTRHGKADAETVEVFRTLQHGNERLAGSGYSLAALGKRAKPFAPLLRSHITGDPSYFTAEWVQHALPDLAELIPDAAGDFVRILNAVDVNGEKHRVTARIAADCLGRIGKPNRETIAALERWATDAGERYQVAREAAVALLKLDPKNETAKRHLLAAAKRSGQSDVAAATFADVNADGTFTPTMVGMATGEIPCPRGYRLNAFYWLGQMGPKAKGEAKQLMPLLDEGDQQFQVAAMIALIQIDADRTDTLLPKLLDLIDRGADLSDGQCDPFRLFVERKLLTKEVRRTLHVLLDRTPPLEHPAHRVAAALFELDPDDPVAVKWFEARLKDWADDIRKPGNGSRPDLVFRSLQKLGPKAKRFAPILVRLLRDCDFKTDCGNLVHAIRETTK